MKELTSLGVNVVLGERITEGLSTPPSSNITPLPGKDEDPNNNKNENNNNNSNYEQLIPQIQQQKVTTDKGREISTQLIVLSGGSKLNGGNGLLQKHFAEALNEEGRLKVDEHFRVKGFENIYAIGDITDIAEEKLGYLAGAHAAV